MQGTTDLLVSADYWIGKSQNLQYRIGTRSQIIGAHMGMGRSVWVYKEPKFGKINTEVWSKKLTKF